MTKQPTNARVFLDDQPVSEANAINVMLGALLQDDLSITTYEIKVGDRSLVIAADPDSEVHLYTKDLEASVVNPVNILIVVGATINGAKISGTCSVARAQLSNVSLDQSTVMFSETSNRYASRHLEDLILEKTDLLDSIVDDGLTLVMCELTKSILGIGKDSFVRGLTMEDSSILCTGPTIITGSYITKCRIEFYNSLTIKGVNWSGMRFRGTDLAIENIFHSFKIDFPYTGIYFYRTGPKTYSLGLHDVDYELPCDDKDFEVKLRQEILAGEERGIVDELVRYVNSSINSRTQIIDIMELREKG